MIGNASEWFFVTKGSDQDVDDRDKPGHDGE